MKKGRNVAGRAPRGRQVFEELQNLVTEKPNSHSRYIDRVSTIEALHIMNREDASVARAVKKELPHVAQAVNMVVDSLRKGGRLFYMGAGTSGRLGVLDAAECPPTFGTDPSLIRGIIAGGHTSLVRSSEGVEDDTAAAIRDIGKYSIGPKDVVVGVTASKRTPYVLAGLSEAKRLKAKTVFISCNPRSTVPRQFDVAICPVVGPEIIAGSSRMKAGTAQKMILNMISTASMIRLGKIYGNRMVDLRATSEKLKERSKKIIMETCGVSYEEAEIALEKSGGHVKTAIIMLKMGLSRPRAERLLKKHQGFVFRALSEPDISRPDSRS
jgi:N-acetylmuramic acid 6-phosphate etherase